MSVAILTAEERTQGLGGTDVAAIVGVSSYRTPIEVYLEKRGERPAQEQSWRMRMGQILEDAIADAYAESTGRQLVRIGVVRHKTYPFLYVHPDRRVVGEPGLVECKATSRASSYADGPPPAVRVQTNWQMALTDRLWVDVAVLSATDDIAIHRVDRDQGLIDALIEAAVAFWTDHVQTGIPPEVDGTDAYRRYLAARHQPVEEERTATAEQVLLLDELRLAQRAEKDAAEHVALIKNRLAEQMGTATRLLAPQGNVTYRMQKASEYVVKREETRVLRVNWKKEETDD
jgi:putative phage-type endonuclease